MAGARGLQAPAVGVPPLGALVVAGVEGLASVGLVLSELLVSFPAPPLSAPAAPDYAEELQKLAELKAAGVINDEEFEAKKKQILGI